MDNKGRISNEASATIKLLLLGDGAVGKSSLMLRYCEDSFNPNHILTIGVDFKSKIINVDNERIKLQIWDTAGQERFRNITPVYFRSAMGVVLVFDVSSMESFESITFWLDSLEAHASPTLCKVLVGNKIDLLKRQVSRRRAEALAVKFGIQYFETSAMKNVGVEELFMQMASLIRRQQTESRGRHEPDALAAAGAFHLSPDVSGNGMELESSTCCWIKLNSKGKSRGNSVERDASPKVASPEAGGGSNGQDNPFRGDGARGSVVVTAGLEDGPKQLMSSLQDDGLVLYRKSETKQRSARASQSRYRGSYSTRNNNQEEGMPFQSGALSNSPQFTSSAGITTDPTYHLPPLKRISMIPESPTTSKYEKPFMR